LGRGTERKREIVAFELQEVTDDPDLAEPFTISRQTGVFAEGGWQTTPQDIQVFGVVTVATQKELQMIPEGDRVSGARMFFCSQAMYVTNEENGITSDILIWNTHKYRVAAVGQFQNRGGFYYAIAQRMAGN
jgi:hypothetical protein